MKKNLNAKIQKINPKIDDASKSISGAIEIQPDSEAILEKKGVVYTVFEIIKNTSQDKTLVTKIVTDVLHDAYFQSESSSPIQSIEKAILKLRDNIMNMTPQEQDAGIFNIATTVLWGNTLYVVQYGDTKVFLMRQGKIKPIESATEGKFSVASGVVKDNDVILLQTTSFTNKFPPEKLLSATEISPEKLKETDACLIIKVEIIKTLSNKESINFADPENPGEVEQAATGSETSNRKTLKKEKPKKKPSPKMAVLVILGLLIILGLAAGIDYISTDNEETVFETQNEPQKKSTQTNENDLSPVDTSRDEELKITRVEPTVFYDLLIADENSNPIDLAAVNTGLYALDESGELFFSDFETPRFAAVEGDFTGVKKLLPGDLYMGMVKEDGFLTYSVEDNEVFTQRESENTLGATGTYLGFIYSVTDDIIYKYEDENPLEGDVWTQNAAVAEAKDLGIDVRIYVLTKNDELLEFTTGTQQDFEIKGLETPLNNVAKMLTTEDLKNIYLADSGNNRLVVLDKDGELVAQYRLLEENKWGDIRGVAVRSDETKAYLLDGTAVYEFDL